MAKRTNIRRRGKSWIVYFRADGKQHFSSYKTREEAELYLTRSQAEKARGEFRAPQRVTFGEALDEWLRWGEHERGWKATTLGDYKSAANLHLRPPFGHLRLEAVTADAIERWRGTAMARKKNPIPRRTADKLTAMLHGIFERARKAYGHPHNPVRDVTMLPVNYSGRFDHYSSEEVHALVRAAASDQDGALFLTAAFTGLRRGELIALTVGDVDFAGEAIRVRGSVAFGELTTPKSGKVRSVPMVAEVAQALARLLQRDNYTADSDPVFVGEAGGYSDASALRRRFIAARDNAELRPLRFHDLRHSFGSLAARMAESPRELQEWMGHADLKTTARYTHYRPRGGEAERLARALVVDEPAEAQATELEAVAGDRLQ
jgi:integrase